MTRADARIPSLRYRYRTHRREGDDDVARPAHVRQPRRAALAHQAARLLAAAAGPGRGARPEGRPRRDQLPRHRSPARPQGAHHGRRLRHRRGGGHRVRARGCGRGAQLPAGGAGRRGGHRGARARGGPQGGPAARGHPRPRVLPLPGRRRGGGPRRARHPGEQRGAPGVPPELRRAGRGRPGPHDPDEPVRDVLDHARRPAAPAARARRSSTARRSRGTTRRR